MKIPHILLFITLAVIVTLSVAQCTSNDDCEVGAPICDTVSKECQLCLVSTDCTTFGDLCRPGTIDSPANTCVSPTEDFECVVTAECSEPEYFSCVDNLCTRNSCATSSNCRTDEVCNTGSSQCETVIDGDRECYNTSDCSASEVCSAENLCVPATCSNGGVTCQPHQFCESSSSSCQPHDCLLDTDCDGGNTCNKSAEKYVCIENTACSDTILCAGTKVCFESVCQAANCANSPTTVMCTADEWCNASHTSGTPTCQTQVCNSTTLPCGTGSSCDETNEEHVCTPDPTCTTSSECTTPQLCNGGKCVTPPAGTECYADTDCTTLGHTCQAGKCATPTTPTCTTSGECDDGELCNTTGQCVDPPQNVECYRTGDCTTGLTCSSDNRCIVACENSGTCTGGQLCDTTGECVTPPATYECYTSFDCQSEGEGWDCAADHKCVNYCTDSSDCTTSGWICNITITPKPICQAPTPTTPCFQDGDCTSPNPACKLGASNQNACVPCTSSDFCTTPDKPICKVASNTCIECDANSQCAGKGLCDATTNQCTPECTTSDDCSLKSNGLNTCDTTSKLCVACLADDDCTDNAFGLTKCSTTTKTCVKCTANSDCDSGYECTSNLCFPMTGDIPCTGHNQCPPTRPWCYHNKCATTRVPIPECIVDLQCAVGSKCVNETCIVIPDACTEDSQCLTAEGFQNLCDVKSGLCVPPSTQTGGCTRDQDCGDGYFCNTVLKVCVNSGFNISVMFGIAIAVLATFLF